VTNQGETTWLAVTLHCSPAISQTSQGCQAVVGYHKLSPINYTALQHLTEFIFVVWLYSEVTLAVISRSEHVFCRGSRDWLLKSTRPPFIRSAGLPWKGPKMTCVGGELWVCACPHTVFHWMRPIAIVLYALRPFFSHLMYFVLPELSCVLPKIKLQAFEAFWGYFISLIFLIPPPSQV